MNKAKKMDESEIEDVIFAFVEAARRAVEAGADAVQLHCAQGYLLGEFLSPFFNDRQDGWGGSDEKRFRLVREIILNIKKELSNSRRRITFKLPG